MRTQRETKRGLLRRLGRALNGLRAAVFDAAAAEHARAEKESVFESEKDFFERLPDPPPHFENGDIKYFDGKFRYF